MKPWHRLSIESYLSPIDGCDRPSDPPATESTPHPPLYSGVTRRHDRLSYQSVITKRYFLLNEIDAPREKCNV